MAKVAIVILNWNGRKLLEQFLPSVIGYSAAEDVDIIVADNQSDDDSLSFLNSEYPQIRCIALARNYGYAGGYNEALKLIDAQYFVLLNSDVEVTPGWLDPLIAYLDANDDVAAVQPKILAQRNKQLFEYAGAAGGYIDKYGYPFCRGRIFRSVEADSGQYNTPADVLWASGACLCIRSCDFFAEGGFDALFFAHMEEIDLCWRLNIRGRRIVCLPQSEVYHVGGATLAEESPRKTFLNFRNNLLMLYKNLPTGHLSKIMWIRFCLDYLAALQFLLKGKFGNAAAVLKAHREFRLLKKEYSPYRSTDVNIKSALSAVIYKHCILVDYYFKGRKSFSQLNGFDCENKL